MSTVVEQIQNIEGETPRVVAELTNVDYTIEFMREDVENLYSVEDLDEAYTLVMANQVTGNQFKDLIGRTNYNAQSLFFGDIVVFLFHSDRYEAVFASFDFEEGFPASKVVNAVANHQDESRPEEEAEA